MTEHIVDRQDLETKLQLIKNKCKDPKYGVFGPDSMYWKMGKESILFLGAGYALLMQEAHPWVATGAHHHSKIKNDPFGRWKRTFESVNSMIFGDLDTAFKVARMIHNIHSKVVGKLDNGEQYAANNEDALLWVAATLAYTTVWMHELGVKELTTKEKDQFYEEFKLFCFLFGISEETIPKNWGEFIYYYDCMIIGKLRVDSHGKELIKHFTSKFENKFHPLRIPSEMFMTMTSQMLPRRIAKQYGFENDGIIQELSTELVLYGIGKLYSKLPKKARMNPYYRSAMKKINNNS